ncbi:hypothetical protein Tco_0625075 [Tanacetum coccineum]|uniref:Retrovirus-related Pol polyprotein from transposon TNT 1-94-like beta-barrel domain-containing protein n=1 Tax=Tanacetum coccineum TaxID=301880 RepID=A0ABQ4WFT3_9ASTR
MAQSSNEIALNYSYYSDNASSLDNDNMHIEYDSLCEISLKIINKNKILKYKRDLLEKEILELNEKIKKLKRSKEIKNACKSCEELKSENAKLKETQVKFVKFNKSANSLREMLNKQKLPSRKIGLGFDSSKASTCGTKIMSFVESSTEKAMDGSTIKVHGSTMPGSVCLRTCLEPDEWIKDSGCSKHMTGNKSLFSTYKAYDGVKESLNVTFDEIPPLIKLSPLVDDDVGEEEAIKKNTKVVNETIEVSRNKARLVARGINQERRDIVMKFEVGRSQTNQRDARCSKEIVKGTSGVCGSSGPDISSSAPQKTMPGSELV